MNKCLDLYVIVRYSKINRMHSKKYHHCQIPLNLNTKKENEKENEGETEPTNKNLIYIDIHPIVFGVLISWKKEKEKTNTQNQIF